VRDTPRVLTSVSPSRHPTQDVAQGRGRSLEAICQAGASGRRTQSALQQESTATPPHAACPDHTPAHVPNSAARIRPRSPPIVRDEADKRLAELSSSSIKGRTCAPWPGWSASSGRRRVVLSRQVVRSTNRFGLPRRASWTSTANRSGLPSALLRSSGHGDLGEGAVRRGHGDGLLR
jgi:hypothetical protein